MAEYQMELVRRTEVARGTMAFWFDPRRAKYEFRAGQHADFSFTQPLKENATDNARTFSLASSPSDEGPLMIAMRMRETGFKNAISVAPLGTTFKVSRPRGSFTLHQDSTRPAVFLAGGIGITPMRSILHWAAQERLTHKMYLFYSNRAAEDVSFLPDLEELSKRSSTFTFVPTITRPTDTAWRFQRGPIDRALLTQHLGKLGGPIYYVSGPSGLVSGMISLLKDSGISDDDIRTEEFGDYR